MTPEAKAALRRAAEAATPGPWKLDGPLGPILCEYDRKIVNAFFLTRGDAHEESANAVFIALCDPQTIIGLLDEVERLEGNQRRTGTVEICQHYRTASCGENEDHMNMGVCGRKTCPIRAQQAKE